MTLVDIADTFNNSSHLKVCKRAIHKEMHKSNHRKRLIWTKVEIRQVYRGNEGCNYVEGPLMDVLFSFSEKRHFRGMDVYLRPATSLFKSGDERTHEECDLVNSLGV